jgi:hypothetical protein
MPAGGALIFVIVFKTMAARWIACRNSRQKPDWREAEHRRSITEQT